MCFTSESFSSIVTNYIYIVFRKLFVLFYSFYFNFVFWISNLDLSYHNIIYYYSIWKNMFDRIKYSQRDHVLQVKLAAHICVLIYRHLLHGSLFLDPLDSRKVLYLYCPIVSYVLFDKFWIKTNTLTTTTITMYNNYNLQLQRHQQ